MRIIIPPYFRECDTGTLSAFVRNCRQPKITTAPTLAMHAAGVNQRDWGWRRPCLSDYRHLHVHMEEKWGGRGWEGAAGGRGGKERLGGGGAGEQHFI